MKHKVNKIERNRKLKQDDINNTITLSQDQSSAP